MSEAKLATRAESLAWLVLRLGQVRRATQHPDGEPESDTTHTVMLGLLASAMAAEVEPELDPGQVALFALVHDLCEAYAGDVNTARRLTPEERQRKAAAEALALVKVRNDLAGFPLLLDVLDEYEEQKTPEARWVRYVDKLCPKVTHMLNRGLALRAIGMTEPDVLESHRTQGAELREEYPEFEILHEAFDEVCAAAEEAIDYGPGSGTLVDAMSRLGAVEVRRIPLKPGDILWLTSAEPLSNRTRDRLCERIEEIFSQCSVPGVRVLLADDGVCPVAVLGGAEAESSEADAA